ncbi:MAG: radical SAM/SPASM domain-containing protein [Terracidiphilus sp.]
MTQIAEPREPGPGLLSNRLFDFAGRIPEIDPQLARVLVPWMVRHRRYVPGFLRLARTLKQSGRVRARHQAAGVRVPPFLILSVTSRCNLRCSGCYATGVGVVSSAPARTGLGLDEWRRVVAEAVSLGVMAFIVAGGEPFLLPGIVNLFRDFPDRLFLVYTNGTALKPEDCAALKKLSNVVVMVSIEGDRALTDRRRGSGVFDRALGCLDLLRDAGVLTGIAVTVEAGNVEYWSDPANIDGLTAHTGPLIMFIEQIPEAGCDSGVQLTPEQQRRFRQTVLEYRERPAGGAFIVHSPADEEALGGCVSAGRGFAHVAPTGDVTACPVSALATHSVRTSNLRDALSSPLFSMIRDNGHLLETEGHPCGLSAHAAELEAMASGLGAYHAGVPDPAPATNWPVAIR